MLKRAITYQSYDGETVTEDFSFHIKQSDIAKLELGHIKGGGLKASIEKMMQAQDGASIVAELDKIIRMSVGRKSEDGRRFIRNKEIEEDFMSSPAYEVIFMELVTDPEKTAAFIAGAVGGDIDVKELQEKAKNVFEEAQPDKNETGDMRIQPEPRDPTATDGLAATNTPRVLTRAEVTAMPHTELSHLLATGQAIIGKD